MKKAMLQAHRGVASEYPENTMAAYRAAVEQGYDIIELDPDYTSDGAIVVFHDRNLARTARNADGSNVPESVKMREITYSEAMKYDYGMWMGEKFKGEKLPTLEEALAFSKENNIPLKIDNKIWSFPDDIKEKLFALLEKYNAPAVLTCGNMESARTAVKRFPGCAMHYDGEVTEENLKELSTLVDADKLIVWLAFPNKQTEWVTVRRADKELCKTVKAVARLGIWILSDYEDFEVAVNQFGADVIETTGHIKP